MTRSIRTFSLAIAMLLFVGRRGDATTVIGDLNNFDTVNDTGQRCYGFEIEIDDVHSTDITYTYDWNHYGAPKIREDGSDPLHPKVFVRYESSQDANGAWGANDSFTNQVIPTITPPAGHSCTDPSVNEGCEHFGVGYYGAPTTIKYSWLVDGGGGTLATFGSPVGVATPSWVYTPPAPMQAAQVVAAIPAPVVPIPAGKQYGEPTWVKVIKTTTHNADVVELRELISDDADGDGKADWRNQEPDETETEWKLLQANRAGDGNKDELQGGADDMGDGTEKVTRRYEFYRYGAAGNTLDGENGEAMCDEVDPTADPDSPSYLHGIGDHVAVTDANGDTYYVDCAAQTVVGTFIGAQMAGFDAAAPLGLIDNLQDGAAGQPYTARTVVVGGNSPYAIGMTGALPDGMMLGDYADPATSLVAMGVLSGTPTTSGDFAFTVDVTDADGTTVSKAFVLHVVGAVASTTTTTSSSTTTTTTTVPPPPSCSLGAGIPRPPKPPANAGHVKIAKGLTGTPATKTTKLAIAGTLEDCRNFPVVPGAPGPITNGTFKLSLEIPPGSTCAALAPGLPVKSTLSITWSTPDPTKPGKLKKVGTEKTTIASYEEPSIDPIVIGAASRELGPKSTTPGFAAAHAVLSLTMDQTAAQIAAGCTEPKKGLAALDFTGANGPSTLEIR